MAGGCSGGLDAFRFFFKNLVKVSHVVHLVVYIPREANENYDTPVACNVVSNNTSIAYLFFAYYFKNKIKLELMILGSDSAGPSEATCFQAERFRILPDSDATTLRTVQKTRYNSSKRLSTVANILSTVCNVHIK